MSKPGRVPASKEVFFDAAIVLLYALCLALPRLYPAADRTTTADPPSAGAATLTWLALPVTLARHGIPLDSATVAVTSLVLTVAAAGAMLAVAARMRGSAARWAAGAWLSGCAVAILMPAWIAVGFLGALLLVVALRSRLAPLRPIAPLPAVLAELWPLGYAGGFAVLAWRYNPQLLLRCLLIAFGVSLVGRALLPQPAIGGVEKGAA